MIRATVNARRVEFVEVEVSMRDALYAAWAAWLKTRLKPHNTAGDVLSTWPQRHDIRDGKWVCWLRSYYTFPSELNVPATSHDMLVNQAFRSLDELLKLTPEDEDEYDDEDDEDEE